MFTTENLIHAGQTFLMLFGELFGLFIGISFVVALLQIYISQDRIKRILTTPKKGLNSVLGALLGSVTPFCSCSTIPVLVGLFKSGAPFCGAISFLLTSPILNPAIITLMLAFFGVKATIVYAVFTFLFAVVMGLILDAAGFEKEIKNVTGKGGHQDGVSWEKLQGTFWQKQLQAFKISLKDAFGLFRGVVLFLLLGAGIGAFIYEFVPTDLLANFAGASNLWAVPVAAVVGIPMYIRTETMIPIASILISKGVAPGVMIALILGGIFSSPCATPVLVVLLGLVARSGNVTWGILLLLCYSIGHSVLVLAAGTSIGFVRKITASPQYGRFSAALKIIMGTAILAIALYMFYLSF